MPYMHRNAETILDGELVKVIAVEFKSLENDVAEAVQRQLPGDGYPPPHLAQGHPKNISTIPEFCAGDLEMFAPFREEGLENRRYLSGERADFVFVCRQQLFLGKVIRKTQ